MLHKDSKAKISLLFWNFICIFLHNNVFFANLHFRAVHFENKKPFESYDLKGFDL
jgi:hypothetical protein